MNKNEISLSFGRQAHTYNEYAFIQRIVAEELMQHVKRSIETPTSIVDIGTGTGTLLPFLRNEYPNALLYCNDIAQGMLDTIDMMKYRIADCICADAEEDSLPYASLYISNFAFQWFKSLYKSIARLARQCSVLAFTTLLENTFLQWKTLCRIHGVESVMYQYPSYDVLMQYLTQLPHRYLYSKEQYYTVSFPNPRAFLKYIKGLGANTPSRRIFQQYKTLYSLKEEFITEYHVAFVILVNE